MTYRRAMTHRISYRLTLTPLVCLAVLASACVLVVDSGPREDAEYHYRSFDLTHRFEVWVAGDVTFTADDRGVARIAPDGFLHIEERRSFRTRRVTVEPGTAGAVQITHTVNGRAQPDDEAGRDELARLFLRVIRQTAIGAETRVGRLLAERGVDGVFAELARIEGSRATSRYLTALLEQGDLTAAQLARVADTARRKISSSATRSRFLIDALPFYVGDDTALDGYFAAARTISSSESHARVLHAVLEREPDRGMLVRVLRAARSISSSGTKSRVLIAASATYAPDDVMPEAFFDAADSVSSSSDRARVLLALLEGNELDRGSTVSLLESVSRLSSSGSKTRVLAAAVGHYRNDDDVRDAFFAAVDSISSSGEHARALVALLDRGGLDEPSIVSLTRSAGTISSSGEKARVLMAAVPVFVNAPAPRDAFLRAASSIDSSGERARVLIRLLGTATLDNAALAAVLRSAAGIASSGEKTRVLIAAADQVRGNDELRAVYGEVARGISSTGERQRALAAAGLSESEA